MTKIKKEASTFNDDLTFNDDSVEIVIVFATYNEY